MTLISLHCGLDPEDSKTFFSHMTRQHTKFGYKLLSGLIKPRRQADGWTQTAIPRPSLPSDKLHYEGYNDEDLIST